LSCRVAEYRTPAGVEGRRLRGAAHDVRAETPRTGRSLRGCVTAALTAAALPLVLSTGCAAPPLRNGDEIDVSHAETHDDITEIVQYWNPLPWRYDADRRPVGFQTTIYFISGQTGRGAFVPGKILVWLYTLEPGPDGVPVRKSVYGWEFNEAESTLYRVRKKSVQGYYYGFPLLWGPEVNVVGKDIEIVFGYQRLDGSVLTAAGKRFRVPVPPGYRLPSERHAMPPPLETQPAENRVRPALPPPETGPRQ
jgi:hypothetical protein